MNFPTMKRARMYKKPGVYLSGLVLRVAWRCAAAARLAIAPSEFLTSVVAIDFFLSVWSGAQLHMAAACPLTVRWARHNEASDGAVAKWPSGLGRGPFESCFRGNVGSALSLRSRDTGQRPRCSRTLANLNPLLESVVGVRVTANPPVAIRRPRVARAVCAVSKTQAKTEAKTDPGAEAMTAKAGSKAAANQAVTSHTTREAASAEAAVETSAASERQGICRNCCGPEETGVSERDSNFAQHDATPYRPTCGSCIFREDLLQPA